ncbi:hypothetical protein [Variovorax terrae]|uniref:Uncharacterized protein n=1 Tax=Variovorax terrae TaxID=2923278 RepID=A0A9X1W481_9BURK|nr:hypothetical protein [Variovorax terrae]MCJ0765518.1 hypothetical protein [Variovorax terrae]
MSSFVHVTYPAQHPGVARAEHLLEALKQGVVRRYQAWIARRKQAVADEQMLALAHADARVMADISRGMTREAERDVRGYY